MLFFKVWLESSQWCQRRSLLQRSSPIIRWDNYNDWMFEHYSTWEIYEYWLPRLGSISYTCIMSRATSWISYDPNVCYFLWGYTNQYFYWRWNERNYEGFFKLFECQANVPRVPGSIADCQAHPLTTGQCGQKPSCN